MYGTLPFLLSLLVSLAPFTGIVYSDMLPNIMELPPSQPSEHSRPALFAISPDALEAMAESDNIAMRQRAAEELYPDLEPAFEASGASWVVVGGRPWTVLMVGLQDEIPPMGNELVELELKWETPMLVIQRPTYVNSLASP